MEILNKEFVKYSKPMFFNFTRVIIYFATLLIMLGIYSRIDQSNFILINFIVFMIVAVLLITYDVYVGTKKMKTYQNHKVLFLDDYLLFVDHRGVFKLPYSDIKSYQFISDQIIIRVVGNRFVISGRQHGITFDEVKLMTNVLNDKNVISKSSRNFIYFIALFLIINYGSDYLFIQVLNLSSDASLFGTLYICFVLGFGYYIWELFHLRKFKAKEE